MFLNTVNKMIESLYVMFLNNKHVEDTNLSCKYATLALWNKDFRYDITMRYIFKYQNQTPIYLYMKMI